MLHDTKYIVMLCSIKDALDVHERMFIFSRDFSFLNMSKSLQENEWDGSFHELISAGYLNVSKYGIAVSNGPDHDVMVKCRATADVELAKELLAWTGA